jgi:hypothetical protein
MNRRESEAPAIRMLLAFALLTPIAAWGCSGPPAPATPAEAAEVHCNVCGKLVAREGTQALITPEGIDVFTCKKCLARPGRRKA